MEGGREGGREAGREGEREGGREGGGEEDKENVHSSLTEKREAQKTTHTNSHSTLVL